MTPMRTCLLLQVCILDAFASSDFHPISIKDSQRHLSESERASVAFWHVNENRLVDKVYDNDEERVQGILPAALESLLDLIGTVLKKSEGKLAGEMYNVNLKQVGDELKRAYAYMEDAFTHEFRQGKEYESIISLDLTRIKKDIAKSNVDQHKLEQYARLLDFHILATIEEHAPLWLLSAYKVAQTHFTKSQQLKAGASIAETKDILKSSDSFAELFEKKISPMIIVNALPVDSIMSTYKSPALRRVKEKNAITKGHASNDEVPGTFLDYIIAYRKVLVKLRNEVWDKLETVERAGPIDVTSAI